MNRLRKVRIVIAALLLLITTALFLDFTGTIHQWLGWVAKIQLIPALLATHFVVVVVLVVLTLIFGRLYCSVICPLGIFQDVVSRFNLKRKSSYSKPKSWLRYSVLAIFVGAFVLGANSLVALLEPYSSYGRIANTIFAPVYKWGNNILAYFAQRANSYAFYDVDVLVLAASSLAVALITFVVIAYLAWKNGRTYCNTICPVGTILGFLSKFSLYKISVDSEKCNGCRKCVRSCKSSCITPENREIDYSRCVVCFDCIDSCKQGAISYTLRAKKSKSSSLKETIKTEKSDSVDNSKRNMLTVTAAVLASSTLKAEEKLVDGGLAVIEDKKIPKRTTPIVPPGALSLRNFTTHCTGCQLCVSVCPNNVLRPSTNLMNFMQPEVSYEVGYCRPECNKCSEVCPAGAITPIDLAEKSSTQIGHAVLIEKNCVVLTDGVECGNCAVHCPVNAIKMVEAIDKSKYGKRKIPVVDTEKCIGCGACENLCPARPFSAIYVEGHAMHKNV